VSDLPITPEPGTSADALESLDLLFFPVCPFALPPAGQLEFLRRQPNAGFGHKDVSYDPARSRLGGQKATHPSEARRLSDVFTQFSDAATAWINTRFPTYAAGLVRDRVTLRTEEEATRTLRLTARNDLLHIDNFPTRPTGGRRILRLYVNINPTDPQVWATSEPFKQLLTRFAVEHRVASRTIAEWTAPVQSVVRVFTGTKARRTAYDAWMLKLHHFLKEDDAFQAQASRRVWTFPPGSMWLLFADGVAHAQLRGQYSLEHSYFVALECLAGATEAPVHLLAAVGASGMARRAG
jgi:3-deoxy-D-manno-oct-2-ulosonic acid (Kdo) hydroxylase